MQIKVYYNKAVITELRRITSGSAGVEDIIFDFSDEWNNLQKTAVLMREGMESYPIIINGDTIPAQDIPAQYYAESGVVYLGLIGDGEGKRITTNVVGIEILNGTPTSAIEDASLDLYNQVLQIMSDTKSIAQSAKDDANSVRDDANAGKFNGADYIITEADYEAIAEKVLADVDTDLTDQIDYADRTIAQRQKSAVSAINSSRSEVLSDIESSGKTVQAKIALQGINLTTQEIPKAKNQAIGEIDEAKSNALTEVNNSKEEALTQIANNKESAVSEIANKESEALSEIGQSKSDALTDIEQGRVGALSDISDSKESALSAIDEKVENLSLGEQWELCQEITIDETNQATSYMFNQNSEGKPFEYDEIIVETRKITGHGGNYGITGDLNSNYTGVVFTGVLYANILSTEPKDITTRCRCLKNTGRWLLTSVQEKTGIPIYNAFAGYLEHLYQSNGGNNSIKSLSVYFSGSNIATSGTIKIYGRKVV